MRRRRIATLTLAGALRGFPARATVATRLAVLVVASVISAGLVSAPGATAGEYHVYACRTPSGEAAPADGWSPSSAGAYDDYEKDTCADGGALTAALGDLTTHEADVDQAIWTLNVPAGETMVGATLWRAGDTDGGEGSDATYEFLLAGPEENKIFSYCVFQFGCTAVGDFGDPLSEANRVAVPSANLGAHLYVSASCEGVEKVECPAGHGDANGYAAVVDLYAADVTLEQSGGPSVEEVRGPLATETPVNGLSAVLFNASDPGAGVWKVTFEVDGKVVQSTVPNENGGRCRDVGQTADGVPAFLYLQPCPQTESMGVGLDTTVISNGEHHVVVSVVDPAGNSAIVLDREIDVENGPPAAPGLPGSPAVPAKPGRRRLPRARVTLKIEPHEVNLRQRIHFSGRVLGGHIPRGGKLLVLEARLLGRRTSRGRRHRGKWFGFAEPRAGARGRFHGSYRFNVFVGPGEYELRVLAKAETGYPFSPGTSNVVRVRVT
jgi:hypothetical protein